MVVKSRNKNKTRINCEVDSRKDSFVFTAEYFHQPRLLLKKKFVNSFTGFYLNVFNVIMNSCNVKLIVDKKVPNQPEAA